MKKTYLALALASLVAAGTAAAADVQIYGRVDAGLRYTSVKHGDDTLKLESGNRAHNRIGFNVTEDIGNGLKAKAYLENGFTILIRPASFSTVVRFWLWNPRPGVK